MAEKDNGLTVMPPSESEGQPWRIYGTDCQIVEVALAPGESAMCEPGAMCYTSNSVKVKMTASSILGSAMTSESLFKPKVRLPLNTI